MNKIRRLIRFWLVLIVSIFLLGNSLEPTDLSSLMPKISNNNDLDMVNPPQIAATSNYNSEFNITWDRNEFESGNDIVLDSSRNMFITGSTYGPGSEDVLIAKFDSAGNSLLNITWDKSGNERGQGIALDGSGNFYITGYSETGGASNFDAFIAKFDSLGNSLLNITWDISTDDRGYDIALDGSGNIYITGYAQTTAYSQQAFIAKFDSLGNSLFNTTWGGNYQEKGEGIALDGMGNIYITGSENSYNGPSNEAFIAKFNDAGILQWFTTWGGHSNELAHDIVMDGLRNIYITGETSSYGKGLLDAFVAKYDSNGNIQWVTAWGDVNNNGGRGIALDGSGNIYITGYTLTGVSAYDSFIVKFDNSGNEQWNTTRGSSYDEYGNGIALDGSGNIYITGYNETSPGYYDAFIAKYNPINNQGIVLNGGDDDDDDDDDEMPNLMVLALFTIGIISIVGIAIVLIILYKKKNGFFAVREK